MSRTRKSAKEAGTRFETWVSRYLEGVIGDRIERRTKHGKADQGDIAGVVTDSGLDVVVECKDYAGAYGGKLHEWLREAERERVNADADLGVVAFKRSGCGERKMGDQFVAMTLETFARLVRARRNHE